ncbi:sterol desaturase family protein [Paucibacter sp. APW11]|uniref:Sterol desaturase family protein n=1 Tax=Roseateles aquae TaxID=3077235 RepID=A0ABU3P7U3_9BURK|nr:sterol desaturase family protein [Paucibacter sp. APW11]MDT8998630.1 sterol desaturase family protein [Paucibacter sp. APW11]
MLRELQQLSRSHGPLRAGTGLVGGIIALVLSTAASLAALVLRFPGALSTPELRQSVEPSTLQALLMACSVLGGALALANALRGRLLWLSGLSFLLMALAALLGGYRPPAEGWQLSAAHTPYVGLDWFVLDLLASTLIFVFIEKQFPLRPEQPVFRAEWQTDLQHFFVNHLLVGFVLLATNLMVHRLFSWAISDALQAWVQALPFALELLLLMLVADLIQYAVHRALHEWPPLWRFHAVHHSIKTLDWLAGSRLHVGEVLLMRTLVLAPIYVLGFSRGVIDAYIVIIGFQAVLNHCNVNLRLGWLEYVLVTPNFHHWHHSQQHEALDRNYAGQFAFIDHLFGSAVRAPDRWPSRYGVIDDAVPPGFWRQLIYPFSRRT